MDGNERASLLNRASDLVAETLVLDRGSEKPLFQQVYEQIRDLIVDKSLQANMALPSTRALAKDLRDSAPSWVLGAIYRSSLLSNHAA